MLYKSKANRVGNLSLAALGLRIIDTVEKSGIDEALNSKQFQQLEGVNNRYQLSIIPNNASEVSKNIGSLFKDRNNLFIDMFDYVKGQTKSPDTDTKTAAVIVFTVLNKYGRGLTNVKIADLSVRFIRIIEGLKKPELAPAVTLMLLTEKLAEFEQLQLDYEDMYMGYGNVSSARVAPSNIRKEMQDAIKLYVEELKWMANSANTEAWRTLYRNVEQRFNEVNVSTTRKKADTAASNTTTQTV
jgi:hypothetical protein